MAAVRLLLLLLVIPNVNVLFRRLESMKKMMNDVTIRNRSMMKMPRTTPTITPTFSLPEPDEGTPFCCVLHFKPFRT